MDHDACVDVIKNPGLNHWHFPGSAFFSGASDDSQVCSGISVAFEGTCETEAGAYTRSGDNIMAAGVADFFQCIIFAEDTDCRRSFRGVGSFPSSYEGGV